MASLQAMGTKSTSFLMRNGVDLLPLDCEDDTMAAQYTIFFFNSQATNGGAIFYENSKRAAKQPSLPIRIC